MNKGITKSRGKFVAILNSDDEYIPGQLDEFFVSMKKRISGHYLL